MASSVDTDGVRYSSAVRNNLQSQNYAELPAFKELSPAQKFVRLAIEMILESLRQQEMSKQGLQVNAQNALNASQRMFGGLIGESAQPYAGKRVEPIKKDLKNSKTGSENKKMPVCKNVETNKYWKPEHDNIVAQFKDKIEGNIIKKQSSGSYCSNEVYSGPECNPLAGTDPGAKASEMLFIHTDNNSYVIKCGGFDKGYIEKIKEWNEILEKYEKDKKEKTTRIVSYLKELKYKEVEYLLMERAPGQSLAKYLGPLESCSSFPGNNFYPYNPKSMTEGEVIELGRNIGSQIGRWIKAFYEEDKTFLIQTDSDLRNWFYDKKTNQMTLIDVDCEVKEGSSYKNEFCILKNEKDMMRCFYLINNIKKAEWNKELSKNETIEEVVKQKGMVHFEGTRKLLLFSYNFFKSFDDVVKDIDIHKDEKLKESRALNYKYEFGSNIKDFIESINNAGSEAGRLKNYLFKDMKELLDENYINRLISLKAEPKPVSDCNNHYMEREKVFR